MRIGVMLAMACVILSVPKAAAEEKKGNGRLQGAWKVAKGDGFEPKTLIFEGDTLTVVYSESEKKEAKFKIDPKAKPAQIDIMRGDEKSLGIYDLIDGSLRICFSKKGATRPTEFKSGGRCCSRDSGAREEVRVHPI